MLIWCVGRIETALELATHACRISTEADFAVMDALFNQHGTDGFGTFERVPKCASAFA
jgi:hypothetical protein